MRRTSGHFSLRQSGFTLIELLVVILIIGILIAVSAPSFLGQTKKAHDSAAQQALAVAYKAAKADSVDGSPQGAWRTGADLASAIAASEPELSPVASYVDPGNGDITVLGASTASRLALRVTSQSGTVFCLTADANGPMQIAAADSSSSALCSSSLVAAGSTGASNTASHNSVDFQSYNPSAATSSDISIVPADAGASPTGYTLFNAQFTVTAPAASAAVPIEMVFSHLPVGPGETSLLQVWRDGTLVPDCASSTAITANPDPCVTARGYEEPNPSVCGPCGGGFIVVYTSHASLWQVGQTGTSSSPPPSTTIAEGPASASPGNIFPISQGSSGNNLTGDNFSTPFSWSTTAGIVIEDDSNGSTTGDVVVTVDPVSGAKTSLPGMPTPSYAPVISPNGSKIAFVDGSGPYNLEVYDTSSHTVTQIGTGLSGRWLAKSWSPDSSKLAFTDNNSNGTTHLYYAKANGSTGTVTLIDAAVAGQPVDNQSGAWAPAWSVDSSEIFFSGGGDIKAVTAPGAAVSTIVAHVAGFYTYPAASGNGLLAFLSNAPMSGYDVVTATSTGGSVSTLAHIDSGGFYDPLLGFNSTNDYLGMVMHSTVTGDDDVFSITVPGGTVTNLTPAAGTGAGSCCSGVGGAYSWSPSGHWLAYAGSPGDVYEVKVY